MRALLLKHLQTSRRGYPTSAFLHNYLRHIRLYYSTSQLGSISPEESLSFVRKRLSVIRPQARQVMASTTVEIHDERAVESIKHQGSHHHHRGARLRHLLLPNGRKVHIAPSPEDAIHLKKRLDETEKDQSFDLVVNGSPEHLEAVRTVHTYHEERREALREKHGAAFDEFEAVRHDLDVLSNELHQLTDHAVSLDANFDKYGFSAHLRTYDNPTLGDSVANSIHGHDHQHKDWEAEKRNGRVMKIYKTVSTSLAFVNQY